MIALKSPKQLHYERTDPDVQLMLRVRSGDREAFTVLFARHHERVLAVIRHLMGSPTQAEDLAQEVFLRVYRSRATYEPNSKFSTWLFVIVNNVVRNARRSLGRRREVQCDLRSPQQGEASHAGIDQAPEDAALRHEVQQHVRHAISQLSGRQRKALLLFHFDGKSYAEIASSLNTTQLAAKALLHRARVALRDHIEPFVSN